MSQNEMFDLTECEILRETDAAILVATDTIPAGKWVPLSQVDKIVRGKRCVVISTVRMSAWIAGEKGFLR